MTGVVQVSVAHRQSAELAGQLVPQFLTADQHRATRDSAFHAWREVVSVASAA